jgi:hypothetical protein
MGIPASPFDAFRVRRLRRIQVSIMSTPNIALPSRSITLPGSHECLSRPSLADKLDKVFQLAEHMDAKCVCMLDAASQKRRPGIVAREYR